MVVRFPWLWWYAAAAIAVAFRHQLSLSIHNFSKMLVFLANVVFGVLFNNLMYSICSGKPILFVPQKQQAFQRNLLLCVLFSA